MQGTISRSLGSVFGKNPKFVDVNLCYWAVELGTGIHWKVNAKCFAALGHAQDFWMHPQMIAHLHWLPILAHVRYKVLLLVAGSSTEISL